MSELINKSTYPKVLIIGQPFHNKSGGGITISNLFKNWPITHLALATDTKNVSRNNFNYCNNVYRLGKEEFHILYPFNYFFKNGESESVVSSVDQVKNIVSKSKWYYHIIENFFFALGINLFAFRIRSSKKFETWLDSYNPDIIYSQLGKVELLLFIHQLILKREKHFAIHIMDDWPISLARGPLKYYWKRVIDKKLTDIVRLASVNLSISEGMGIEFKRRYGRDFDFFHNPIELNKWKTKTAISYSNKTHYRILYTGRMSGSHNRSIKDVCNAIKILLMEGVNVSIDLFSPDFDNSIAKKFQLYDNVTVWPPIEHTKMPDLLIQYDILFLPLEFSKNGILFTKFSMPTKASEYMISGVPIIVYAPSVSELVRHSIKYNWAHVISDNNVTTLKNGITKVLMDESYCSSITKNAIGYSKENYDAKKIRQRFLEVLSK